MKKCCSAVSGNCQKCSVRFSPVVVSTGCFGNNERNRAALGEAQLKPLISSQLHGPFHVRDRSLKIIFNSLFFINCLTGSYSSSPCSNPQQRVLYFVCNNQFFYLKLLPKTLIGSIQLWNLRYWKQVHGHFPDDLLGKVMVLQIMLYSPSPLSFSN